MQALVLALVSLCLASPPITSSVAGQDTRSAAVAPFVDDQTFAVIHIDVTRVDETKLKELLKAVSGGYDEQGEHAAALLSWIPDFVKAGGKEIYLISGLADLAQRPYFAIVPLANGADAARLFEILDTIPTLKDQTRQQLGSALFVGTEQTFERLKTAKPVARKELAAAFEAIGDSAVQLLLLPTADSRRVIEELVPTVPPEVGGGSVKVLTRGILWAAAGLDATPTASVRFVVQSEDAGKATELANFFRSNLNRFAKLPMAEQIVPGLSSMLSMLTPSENRLRPE